MKQSKNTKLNFVTSFKYWIILPIVIAILAIVLGAIFNLNLDYDFRKVDTFNIQFNATVTASEYEALESEIANIVDKHEICDYRLDRVGEGAQNGVIVKLVANDNYDIDALKLDLEENLEKNIQSSLTTDIIISTTDTITNTPQNVLSMTLYAALAVACVLVLAFIYNWIRYNLVAGYSLVMAVLFEIAMLFGLQVVARIPFNSNFLIAYGIMIITTIIMITCLNNALKENLAQDKYAKCTNAERVISCVKSIYLGVIIAFALAMVALIVVGLMGSLSTLYTMLSILLGLIISILVSLFFYTTIWSLFYKKDKDNMLKKRIALEKKRLEEKDKKIKTDDKIVV